MFKPRPGGGRYQRPEGDDDSHLAEPPEMWPVCAAPCSTPEEDLTLFPSFSFVPKPMQVARHPGALSSDLSLVRHAISLRNHFQSFPLHYPPLSAPEPAARRKELKKLRVCAEMGHIPSQLFTGYVQTDLSGVPAKMPKLSMFDTEPEADLSLKDDQPDGENAMGEVQDPDDIEEDDDQDDEEDQDTEFASLVFEDQEDGEDAEDDDDDEPSY